MTALTEAFDLLLPVDPRNSVVSVGEALIKAAGEKATAKLVADAFKAVGTWMSNEKSPFVSAEHMARWDRRRRRDGFLGLIDDPVFLEPILVTVYLRAKTALGSAGGKQFHGDIENNLKKVQPALRKMSPNFFGEVLVETERRACRDPEYAKTLQVAAAEISAQVPYIASLEESAAMLFARRDGDCDGCIVRACNGLDCRNFCIESWWICFLIFLLIIIIIIF